MAVETNEAPQDASIRFWATYRRRRFHAPQKMELALQLTINISHSSLFPNSTAKPSHARILRGYRTPTEAQQFHDAMKAAS